MLTSRLTSRCPGAQARGWAIADGYSLEFLKKSRDGSGKATLVPLAGKKCYGVIFEIPLDQRDALDRFEGSGYERTDTFEVLNAKGELVSTATYLSKEATRGLLPYHWYKAHIVEGAEKHGLPADYIGTLRSLVSNPDPDEARTKKEDQWRKQIVSPGKR